MRPDELVALRKQMRMTQAELAEKLGISTVTMSRMESVGGKITLRDELAVERLAGIYPPRRHYLIDLAEKRVKPCTLAMVDAENGVPILSDSLITIYLACPTGYCPWPIPVKLPDPHR